MLDILKKAIDNKNLKKLVLSGCSDKTVIRTTGRLTEIKNEVYLALESFYEGGKVVQKNIAAKDAPEYVAELIKSSYKQLNIITTMGDCQVKVSKKGRISVVNHIKNEAAPAVDLNHNRKKKYIIPNDSPVDFLIALGVSDEKGRVFDKKRSKFRQINRFLEIVADVEPFIATSDELYILDLCCGKSYLSFALYYYFNVIRGFKVVMDCVDLKKDVIAYCSEVAKNLGYDNLNFIAGDVINYKIKRKPNLTVSLHACDIATDIVLSKGIESGSDVILSTPCCHHEVMGQLKEKGNKWDFLLEHSILKQKLADAVTDALRCRMLEINGYNTCAMELIDPDETPKNVLIRAVKGKPLSEKAEEKLKAECREIISELGIKPCLAEKYLG